MKSLTVEELEILQRVRLGWYARGFHVVEHTRAVLDDLVLWRLVDRTEEGYVLTADGEPLLAPPVAPSAWVEGGSMTD